MSKHKTCPACGGAGSVRKDKPPRWEICGTCKGIGQVPK